MSDERWPSEIIRKLRHRSRSTCGKRLRQSDVASLVGVQTRSIQQWESGERLPSAHNLQGLIRAFLEEDVFLPGAERQEASDLWIAVKTAHDNANDYRQYPEFDTLWFEQLLQKKYSSSGFYAMEGTSIDMHNPVLNRLTIEYAVDYAHEKHSVATNNRHNLPVQLSSIIGRTKDVEEISALMLKSPLVTLIGTGGCGKTRLALEIGARLIDRNSYGGWFCDLSTITDPSLIVHAIITSLRIDEYHQSSPLETIVGFLQSQEQFLILDNCEHLIEGCAQLVESLLCKLPSLRILATSRESLNIAGETIWMVNPLAFPEQMTSLSDCSLEELMEFDAVWLFVERTRAMNPQFVVTRQEAMLSAEISRCLEGIPLALELAAARTNVLTLRQIADHLARDNSLLTTGRRTAPSRQQTLHATLDWSYSLLTDTEQRLLQRLSVFTGGFTVESMEHVLGQQVKDDGKEKKLTQPLRSFDVLSSLVNKCLVNVDKTESNDKTRYHMLEPIRKFAESKWQETSTDEYRTFKLAYATYFRDVMLGMEQKFRSKERQACLRYIREEYGNLRSILHSATVQRSERYLGQQIVGSLYGYWLYEGLLSEGIMWLQSLQQKTEDTALSESIVKSMHGLGILLWIQGRYDDAYEYAKRSTSAAKSLNKPGLIASTLRSLTHFTLGLGKIEDARILGEESVKISRRSDTWNFASSINTLATVLIAQENYGAAEDLLRQSVSLFKQTGDEWELAGPLRNLGYVMLHRENFSRAAMFFQESIGISQSYNGDWLVSRNLEGLASAACARTLYREAAVLMGCAEALRAKLEIFIVPQFRDVYTQTLSIVKSILGEGLDCLWNQGKAMTREQIISYALDSVLIEGN